MSKNDDEDLKEVKKHDHREKEKKQMERVILREKFLRCIASITGQQCQIKTVEFSNVSGLYHGMDKHSKNIFMKDLKTPYSHLNSGLLRTQDVMYMHFPNIVLDSDLKRKKKTKQPLPEVDDN